MNKIKYLIVVDYEFTGNVILNGIELDVFGTFDVKFRNRYPVVHNIKLNIDFCDLSNTIANTLVNMADLEQQILDSDYGSWYDDYLCAIAESKETA